MDFRDRIIYRGGGGGVGLILLPFIFFFSLGQA